MPPPLLTLAVTAAEEAPTLGGATAVPCPLVPWHAAQLAAKRAAPSGEGPGADAGSDGPAETGVGEGSAGGAGVADGSGLGPAPPPVSAVGDGPCTVSGVDVATGVRVAGVTVWSTEALALQAASTDRNANAAMMVRPRTRRPRTPLNPHPSSAVPGNGQGPKSTSAPRKRLSIAGRR